MRMRGTINFLLMKTYRLNRQFKMVKETPSQTDNTKSVVVQGSALRTLINTLHVLSLRTAEFQGLIMTLY